MLGVPWAPSPSCGCGSRLDQWQVQLILHDGVSTCGSHDISFVVHALQRSRLASTLSPSSDMRRIQSVHKAQPSTSPVLPGVGRTEGWAGRLQGTVLAAEWFLSSAQPGWPLQAPSERAPQKRPRGRQAPRPAQFWRRSTM